MNTLFSPGKMSRTGEKNGCPLLGNPFFPAEAGLSQARPWPPGGTHFFFPAAGWPGDARWPASLFDQNTYFSSVFSRFFAFFGAMMIPLFDKNT